jgi:protein-tyrosine phosphatase
MNAARRTLDIPALLNARDLGGHPTTDGSRTRYGSLIRSDDLSQLDAEGIRALANHGVETVVDLRWAEELELHPNPVPRDLTTIRYRHVSLLASTANEWSALVEGYEKETWKCAVLEHVRAELRNVLSAIAESASGPLLFHCMAGKDRTGIIAALLLVLADVEPESIAQDYALSAEQLREPYLVRYASSSKPADILEHLRCPEAGVHNMLAYLEERGGIRQYLADIGLSEAEIATLRARLRD